MVLGSSDFETVVELRSWDLGILGSWDPGGSLGREIVGILEFDHGGNCLMAGMLEVPYRAAGLLITRQTPPTDPSSPVPSQLYTSPQLPRQA